MKKNLILKEIWKEDLLKEAEVEASKNNHLNTEERNSNREEVTGMETSGADLKKGSMKKGGELIIMNTQDHHRMKEIDLQESMRREKESLTENLPEDTDHDQGVAAIPGTEERSQEDSTTNEVLKEKEGPKEQIDQKSMKGRDLRGDLKGVKDKMTLKEEIDHLEMTDLNHLDLLIEAEAEEDLNIEVALEVETEVVSEEEVEETSVVGEVDSEEAEIEKKKWFLLNTLTI